jgi:hypothetical protein
VAQRVMSGSVGVAPGPTPLKAAAALTKRAFDRSARIVVRDDGRPKPAIVFALLRAVDHGLCAPPRTAFRRLPSSVLGPVLRRASRRLRYVEVRFIGRLILAPLLVDRS